MIISPLFSLRASFMDNWESPFHIRKAKEHNPISNLQVVFFLFFFFAFFSQLLLQYHAPSGMFFHIQTLYMKPNSSWAIHFVALHHDSPWLFCLTYAVRITGVLLIRVISTQSKDILHRGHCRLKYPVNYFACCCVQAHQFVLSILDFMHGLHTQDMQSE